MRVDYDDLQGGDAHPHCTCTTIAEVKDSP